jgi:DNA-binding NarL/FixJ family response regulator
MQRPAAHPPSASPRRADDTPPPSERTPPVVFLLDDEPIVQELVRAVLARNGLEVVASALWSDVGRQLMAVRGVRPSVLISDLNLPGIRGEDFCRTVLKYRPTLSLVLYTGVEPEVAQEAARRLGGAVRFVLKREGPERLCTVVRELLLSGAQ